MPIVTNFDSVRSEVHAIAIEVLTFDDLRSHICLTRTSHDASHPELIDARKAEVALGRNDLERVADLFRREARETPLGRTAFVVTSDVAFGLIRSLEQMLEGVCEVRPFRKQDKARAWLAATGSAATIERQPVAVRAQSSSGSR